LEHFHACRKHGLREQRSTNTLGFTIPPAMLARADEVIEVTDRAFISRNSCTLHMLRCTEVSQPMGLWVKSTESVHARGVGRRLRSDNRATRRSEAV